MSDATVRDATLPPAAGPARPASGSRGPSLVRALASSWLGLAVGIGIAFFLSPYVVRTLGAEWYGVWAVSVQFTGYLYLLDFGLRESVIRYTSKYAVRGQGRLLSRVLSAALLLYGLITVLTLLATAIAVWGIPRWFSLEPRFWRDARVAIAFAGLTIAQTFVVNIFFGVISGLRRWDLANAAGVVANLVRSGLIVVFLSRGYGIIAVAAIQFFVATAAGVVTIAIALSLLKQHGLSFTVQRLSAREFVALARRVLGYGFYIIVSNVGEKVIGATDALIVGIFLPIASVAYYAIAGSLVGYVKSILATTAQVFNPLASHLHTARQGAELQTTLLTGVTINVLTTMPAVVVFILLGDVFIGLWMGPEFAKPSGGVLAILAGVIVFTAPHYIVSSVLYGISRHRSIALMRIGEAVANLVLSIVLVRTIGLTGVAWGTVIPSAVIAIGVTPFVVRRVVKISVATYFDKAYIRPAIAALPMALVALLIRDSAPPGNLASFVLCVAGLLVLYAPCALMLGLGSEERELVLGQLRPRVVAGLRLMRRPSS